MNNYKWKIGDRFYNHNRFGTILDLFEGTEREGFWVKVLYDRTEFDDDFWEAIELIQSICLIKNIIKPNIVIRI